MQGRLHAHLLGGSATTCSWPLGECAETEGRDRGIRKRVDAVGAAPESEQCPDSCRQPLLRCSGNGWERLIGLFV